MGYSKDIIMQARAVLAQRKSDRESEYASRLSQAYAQLPQLRELDISLRQTMAKAAQAVFAQGGDVQSAMLRLPENVLKRRLKKEKLLKS